MSRVTRSKATARSTYDRLSRWYDLLAGPGERRLTGVALDKLAARPGEVVLEIGPGAGRALARLARSVGVGGGACGLDLSPGMLREARRRGSGVRLLRGDGARLPFRAGVFDAVFMSFTLELFDTPEIAAVLRECARVLKDGGRVGVAALAQEGGSRGAVRLYEWAHQTFPALVDCRPIRAARALEESGFRVRERKNESVWGLPVEIVIAYR